VLEMRRGGPWIIPTLKGAPRTTKPPLTAWLTAAAVRPATVAALANPVLRTRAYIELGWQSRWPALLASCLMLIATFELALIIVPDDMIVALSAAAICGSCILFQRFARAATTDVYLAFFVTLANLFFAKTIFTAAHKKLYAVAGGVALGLALMSKGPPALAQTIAPLAIYWLWRVVESRRGAAKNPTSPKPRLDWIAIILATIITLLIALPWPIYANLKHPGQLTFWYNETVEGGYAETFKPDPWWGYISIVPIMAPWIVVLLWGIVLIICDMIDRREHYTRAALMLALGVGSIIVMSFFKQKNERYLLPMVGPLAIVAAYGLLRSPPRFARAFRYLLAAQWGLIAFAAVAAPLSFALVSKFTTLVGENWLTFPQASLCAVALLFIAIIGWLRDRRGKIGMPLSGLVIMLAIQLLFIRGYSRSTGGASEMKPLADAIWAANPDFKSVRNYNRPGEPHKVPIDLYIYTNTIIRPIADPAKLPAAAILVSGAANPQSTAPLHGFHRIATVPRGKEFWEAFVRSN
jgi:4-amino-4-deoxy-L-arabinose transferase-like glycosyltransferase